MFDVAQQKWCLCCDNVPLWVDQKRICCRWLSLGMNSNPSACEKSWNYSLIFDCLLPCDPFQASDPAVNAGGGKNPPPGCWGCWTPSGHGVWWRPHWSTGSWKWRTASRSRRICQSQPVPSPFQSPWEHLRANGKVRRWANEQQNSSPFYWGKTKWHNSSYYCQHTSKDMRYLWTYYCHEWVGLQPHI